MALVRSKDTGPEKIVRAVVTSLGYRYRLHYPRLPGHPDLAFPRLGKVIFVHGCFWHRHRCPLGRMPKGRLEFWQTKLERNRVRDRATRAKLHRLGWAVLVIWECRLRDTDRVRDRIDHFLSDAC